DGIELIFTDGALSKIADMTVERKTGARGLRSIIEGVLQKFMFEAPSDSTIKKITITEQTVSGGEAQIER
ncbi:MAG: ATP-dependent Clp protease ATP-binding subunit ClpX, partial [Acutalibacteraceae bacterium]|nr:ATP-dependent Clp protease ATP-binding subunit ClpX [Acutalibacteraceae bacterium]